MGKRRAAEKIAESLDDCLVEIRYLVDRYQSRVQAALERESDPERARGKFDELRRELNERFGGEQ
ncbi:hypothetical protein BMJ34_02550 [Sinorhizobium medicae]|uniref:Uncharacterized protein n=1 Tax=Sinorhizobium medicae TaxID=110321 RepID=A0ABX4TNY0_9HYPH|nr:MULTISPECIES: hypothetical protein [Sinorhizobium]PLU04540.1 hypothetical protein BMJ33_11805 [Sinorhizobium medicae]PLU08429.1 hypothetical protein BMJ34_02550 [Sinorhizobium medicae]PLU20182.1 hypothetical protein BMJ29_13670 [Sinorhizobium medicae]PLU30897.1 hypothetical protein BMJ27_22730 [Sinorhizobium medicae]PLU74616.1 hypothetical protein BMJ19_37135 [Sinorhizobium medicae]